MTNNNLSMLLTIASSIFDQEASLRKQRFALITSLIREAGGSIDFSYREFNAKIDNRWFCIDQIFLSNNEDYEVFIRDQETGELFDAEIVSRFELSYDDCCYACNDLLEALCSKFEHDKKVSVNS